jgi:signal peptidase I
MDTNGLPMEPKYTLQDIAHLSGDSGPIPDDTAHSGKTIYAVGCAAVWPGLGQLILGKPIWAVAFCVLWIAIVAGILSPLYQPQWLAIEIVLLPLAVVFLLAQIIHAACCARRSPLPLLGDPITRFTAGVLLTFLGIAEIYAAITCLQNNWVEFCYSPTDSMGPAVSPGDIFLNFKHQSIGRWDIIAINAPPGVNWNYPSLCKRVAGVPGDTLEITGPALLINGKPTQLPPNVGPYQAVDTFDSPLLDAEPLSAANGCWGRPITLGPDEYFLLGDNSPGSYDSRFWQSLEDHQPGAAPRDLIVGKIVAIVWPPQRWRVFESFGGN